MNAPYRPGVVFIGMETSGMLRRRFQALGYETYSADLLPCEDAGGHHVASSSDGYHIGRHIVGDVHDTLEGLWARGIWPTLAIFHPTCTFMTNSAEWAYKDPDFDRYPGVGYHQRLEPGTLFGSERREAREASLAEVRRIFALPIARKVVENPKGVIGSRIRKATQIIQPNWFGDDASKGTCLWMLDKDGFNRPDMKLRPGVRAEPRIVDDGRPQLGLFGTGAERWANQTDAGQNALSPGADRWRVRSRTFPGVADAMVAQWSPIIDSLV